MIFTADILLTYPTLQVKFLRVGNDFFITEPEDLGTLHKELAIKEKKLEEVEKLKSQREDEVDAGEIYIMGKSILVGGASSSLEIPKTNRARNLTIEKLKKQFSDFLISDLSESLLS